MISQKIVQQELKRKGGIEFEDSAKGKIARREVQELDKEHKQILPLLERALRTIKKDQKLAQKYRWTVDYSKLIDKLEDYMAEIKDSVERGLDENGWFGDI